MSTLDGLLAQREQGKVSRSVQQRILSMQMRGRSFVLQDDDCSSEDSSLEDEESICKTVHQTPHMIHCCHERHKCRVHHTLFLCPLNLQLQVFISSPQHA